MQITLPPEVEKLVQTKVESGAYPSPEDVVRAAFHALQQSENFGDFAPGELAELLADGEASIAADGTLDGDEALEAWRQRKIGTGSCEFA